MEDLSRGEPQHDVAWPRDLFCPRVQVNEGSQTVPSSIGPPRLKVGHAGLSLAGAVVSSAIIRFKKNVNTLHVNDHTYLRFFFLAKEVQIATSESQKRSYSTLMGIQWRRWRRGLNANLMRILATYYPFGGRKPQRGC